MLQGNFDLGAVDGEVVEVHFTLEDSAGVVSTYEGGQMVLRCDGSYRIHLSVVQDDGGRHNLVLSSGDYVWNGATLDLVDSGGHILTASVAGSVIVVHAGGHAFEFYKLVRKPPGNAPCGS